MINLPNSIQRSKTQSEEFKHVTTSNPNLIYTSPWRFWKWHEVVRLNSNLLFNLKMDLSFFYDKS